MSVIKGCSFAGRVSTDPAPLVPMPHQKRKHTEKKQKAQVVCVLCTQHTFQRHPVKHVAVLEQGEMMSTFFF